MDSAALSEFLDRVREGTLTKEEALARLSNLPFEDIGYARVDHHRVLRKGFPEVIFAAGKTAEQTATIFERLAGRSDRVLATHVSAETAERTLAAVAEAQYHATARCLALDRKPDEPRTGNVLVICAGTSDLPVAEEAAITAYLMGARVNRIVDAGVAGIHRLLAEGEMLKEARVVVVVAGMEGALPSVVGGLVAAPVIAVPTSVGYGASFGGLAALLAMLNSCASGVSVVNIDNGFGAGYQAALINRLPEIMSGAEKRDA
ncbi:MAG: Pyridinium-3,5-biscarboxylic acid mononucleotide synthase [bacterium]|nr:Pyridinium-3,5-biscarboxylic acid mononucleotide synthase [bacterium]